MVKEPKDKEKEETSSNPEEPASKPQSAGASVKDAAQKVLLLCQKSEWGPVDQVLKSMEKSIAAAGEDANICPLAGIADTVGIFSDSMLLLINLMFIEQTFFVFFVSIGDRYDTSHVRS